MTSKELRHKLTQGQGKEIGGALQPHHTQASEQLGRTYTAHCNTLFIEIAKTDKCSGTVILFAHRVFILYIFRSAPIGLGLLKWSYVNKS